MKGKRLYFLLLLSLFILRERGRESTSRGGAERERERERERIPSRLHAISAEPNVGLKLMNREIMTWAEIKSCPFNRLSHIGTLRGKSLHKREV